MDANIPTFCKVTLWLQILFQRVQSAGTFKELRKHTKNANWFFCVLCWNFFLLPGGSKKVPQKRCLQKVGMLASIMIMNSHYKKWFFLFLRWIEERIPVRMPVISLNLVKNYDQEVNSCKIKNLKIRKTLYFGVSCPDIE